MTLTAYLQSIRYKFGALNMTSSGKTDDPISTKKPEGENKVRKDLVQVFFGLVLTQIAVYCSTLVEAKSSLATADPLRYWTVWSHLVLAFVITTASWFGWQMAVKNAIFKENDSIFQWSYLLSVLDIILVGLYFLLVHQVELLNVTAFPTSSDNSKLVIIDPSSRPEAIIIFIIFVLYLAWDVFSWIAKEKEYGPWPSVICSVLTAVAVLIPRKDSPDPMLVITLDAYLATIAVFFRALKQFQKWRHAEKKASRQYNWKQLPLSIKLAVIGSGSTTIVLVSIAWLNRMS